MAKPNIYPGNCRSCGTRVAAHAGVRMQLASGWAVYCKTHNPDAPKPREPFKLADGDALDLPGIDLSDLYAHQRATVAKRGVFVTPTAVRVTIQREAEAVLPGVTTAILTGRKADRAVLDGVGLAIIGIDVLDAWAATLESWADGVVIDEAHTVKSFKAKRTKAAAAKKKRSTSPPAWCRTSP